MTGTCVALSAHVAARNKEDGTGEGWWCILMQLSLSERLLCERALKVNRQDEHFGLFGLRF